ncbi:MAG: hypothetical protein EPN84_07655, partial [Legionella sp.]
MALSASFLELFATFVNQYEKGNDGIILKSGEIRAALVVELRIFLNTFRDSAAVFNDINVIEAFHSVILDTYKTHPYLVQCWCDFFAKYKEKTNTSFPTFTSLNIPSRSNANPGEKLLSELNATINSMMKAHAETQKLMLSELERLTNQVASLSTQLQAEKERNMSLQLQIRDQTVLNTLQPEVEKTAKQLDAAANLLKGLAQQLQAPLSSTSVSVSAPVILKTASAPEKAPSTKEAVAEKALASASAPALSVSSVNKASI